MPKKSKVTNPLAVVASKETPETKPVQSFTGKKLKGYTVRFPDGGIHPRWIYETKQALKEQAPGELFGDVSTWKDAKRRGYRIRKVQIRVG